MTPFWRVLLLAALLLGFAVRVYDLEGQSMWSDEGLSLYRARQPLAQIHQNIITVDGINTQDTTPPFYFYLLHAWRAATGEGVFTLRFVSVLLGVLAIPFAYLCGKLLTADYRVGVMAAVFLAISPLHVWESQELRNYSLLVLLNFISVYGLWRFVLRGQHGRWLALWLAGSLLGIYSHYFSFFVFAYGLLVLAVWTMGHYRQQLWQQKWVWLGGLTSILLILPILPIASSRFLAGQQVDFFHIPLRDVLNQVISAYGVGISPSLTHPWLWWLPAAALALAGLIFLWPRRPSRWLLLSYQFIPFALLLLLSLFNPLYNGVRHTILGLPPFLLFMGCGAVLLPTGIKRGTAVLLHSLQFLLILLVLGIQINWLQAQFTWPALRRDDIRAAAEYLNQFATADDLVILHDTLISFTFDYYYHGDAPTRNIPLYGQFDVAAAEAELSAAGTEGRRIWFLAQPTPRNGFPREALWEWADAHWPRFFERDFPSLWLRVQLNGYLPEPEQAQLPAVAQPIAATFGDTLHLEGVVLPTSIQAGDVWWSTFYWRKEPGKALDDEYSLSLRFVDEDGRIWQQNDNFLWFHYPPPSWPTDSLLQYEHESQLAVGLPPGVYTIWLRLLDKDLQPVASNGDIDLRLGNVTVRAGTDAQQLPPITRQQTRLGDISLLGYTLPTGGIRPGHLVPLELYWQARQTPPTDYQLQVELLNRAGEVVAEILTTPTRSDYPTSQWAEGAVLSGQVDVVMPALATAEPHQIRLRLLDTVTGQPVGRAVTLRDELQVAAWPLLTELPPVSTPLAANFGNPPAITLHGYDLSANTAVPGNVLNLTLYWQAKTAISDNYVVFVHLIAEDGTIITQRDNLPANGFRPTLSWRPDEVIIDEYVLPIGLEVLPGKYQLWVGLYNPESGERPFTMNAGMLEPDGRILITPIVIEPSP